MMKRREFLEFLGRTAVGATALGATGLGLSRAWRRSSVTIAQKPTHHPKLTPIAPSLKDKLLLSPELRWEKLIAWEDALNSKGDRFGFNNDYLALVPQGENDALLWVNHEYPDPPFLHGGLRKADEKKTRKQVEIERKAVGGSLLRIRRENPEAPWKWVFDDPLNRRLDADTPIPFAWPEKIAGANQAIGTFGNCGGGQTPWGTLLTCEENFQDFYSTPGHESQFGWERHFPYPVEHYGWVVEVNPLTGAAKKLVALGRFSHESATFVRAKDGRAVVYSGDDANDQCLYKLISNSRDSLQEGTLYVADFSNKRWQPLNRKNPRLAKAFSSETELLIRAREAAKLAGGTPLDRPEDIEIDPRTGAVIIALTNNKPAGRPFGSLLRISEKGADAGALEFESSTFVAGGPESGIACPDNLAFSPNGAGLWVTTDISGSQVGKGPYTPFGNNGLFYIPLEGAEAGAPIRVGSAPVAAELTGPCFSADGKTLFLSVQHPGETSASREELTSHWPDGGQALPRPSVVMITGFSP